MGKNMLKRAAALSLAAFMVVSVAVGCGASKTSNDAKNESKTASTASTAPAKRGKISVSVYDRGTCPPSEGTMEDNRWTKWINQNGPVDVTFVAIPRTKPDEKLNLLFASGSAPDVVHEFSDDIKNSFYNKKLLMPIDDMVNKYSTFYKKLLADNPILKKMATKEDGKMYFFAHINEASVNKAVVIREDWLKKLNLEMPKTSEDVLNVARAFVNKDPDGNGQKDTLGFAMAYGCWQSSAEWFGYLGRADRWLGSEKFEIDYTGLKAYLDFYKILMNEGLIDKDFVLDKTGAKAKAAFISGKAGMYNAPNLPLGFANDEYTNLKKNVPDAKVNIIYPPKTAVGQALSGVVYPYQTVACVNANAKDPEAVMKYMDWIASPEATKAMKESQVGAYYTKDAATGFYKAIDADKIKNEVGYNGDYFGMMTNPTLNGKPFMSVANFNTDLPAHKEVLSAYADYCKALPAAPSGVRYINSSPFMPSLPADLQTIISANSDNIQAIQDKCMLTPAYTSDQAIKDITDLADKAGFKKVDDWFRDYAKNNANNIVPWADTYKALEQWRNISFGK